MNENMNINEVTDTLTHFIDTVMEFPDDKFTPEVTQGIIDTIKKQTVVTDKMVQDAKRQIEQEGLDIENFKNQIENFDDDAKEAVKELNIQNLNKRNVVESIFSAINEMIKELVERVEACADTIVCFQLIHPNAKIPTYAHKTDAGADIYLPEDVIVPAQARGMMIDVGFRMAMKPGWEAQIRPRSGLSHKTTLRISNCVGTIDSSYRNNVGVLVDNLSDEPITLNAGDRIAQMVISPSYHFSAQQVDDVSAIGDNRKGGFGSTGA